MGEVVNLRRVRKHRARVDKEANASANRIAHGTPKALRETVDANRRIDMQRLEAHRLAPHSRDSDENA